MGRGGIALSERGSFSLNSPRKGLFNTQCCRVLSALLRISRPTAKASPGPAHRQDYASDRDSQPPESAGAAETAPGSRSRPIKSGFLAVTSITSPGDPHVLPIRALLSGAMNLPSIFNLV